MQPRSVRKWKYGEGTKYDAYILLDVMGGGGLRWGSVGKYRTMN